MSALVLERRVAAAPAAQRWIHLALLAALGGLVTVHLAVLVYHLGAQLVFPYDLNYGEGYVLNDAVRLATGQPLYVDLQQFPMVRSPYPPLFPLVWSLLVRLSGPVFWAGRALEVLSLAAICGLLAWNAWRVRCGVWPAVAAVGLVVGSPFVYQWAGYARVDLMALMFGVGGVVAAQWVRGWRGVVLSALLCGLALWTKQTAVTASFAVAVALALRNWRMGSAFVALVSVPSIGIGLALNAASNGEFVHHVVLGNASNPVMPLRAAIYVATFALLHVAALVAGGRWLRRALVGRPSPVAVYLVVSLFAAFSAGNGGSSVNYLIEPVVALALVVPFAWRSLPAGSALAGPLFAVMQLAMLVHWPNGFGTSYLAESAIGRTPTVSDAAIGQQLDVLVRSSAGEVLAEPAGFAVRNGREVYVQPIDLRAEELHGRWQPQRLVDALASGRFRQVITAFNLFPQEAEAAIEQHFTLSETLASPDGLTFNVYDYRG